MQLQPQRQAPEVEFDLSLTRSLVPLKDMSESHLSALLDDAIIEMVCAGQTLFTVGSYDAQHVYLLHGDVTLVDEAGASQLIKGRTNLLPIAHRQPRQVTAIAQTDCSLLRVNTKRLDELLTWSQVADYLQLRISLQRDLDEDVDWMMTLLRSNLFFKVPPLNVEEIFTSLQPQVVYAGDVIIRQGEVGEQCYFIKEGEADVSRHQDGKPQLLATVGVGRCFGEDALVNDAARNASVVMRTDGVLMTLNKHEFYRLLKEPKVPTYALQALPDLLLQGVVAVDVRSEEEYSQAHLPHAVNVPLNILAIKARLLKRDITYIFYCDTGRRSRAAAYLMAQQGYKVFALEDCVALFAKPLGESLLSDTKNYLLRDGLAVVGGEEDH